MSVDQDSVWKEVIDDYFPEFMAFFFPLIWQDIDWDRKYEFLDKELEKIVQDSDIGRRLADKLVKVYLYSGKETWLLIHIEVQGKPDPDFARRMYIYNYRIFDRYQQEVVSLAVLTDKNKRFRPDTYQVKRWGFAHTFHFPVIKILDYAQEWHRLEADPNPFALVVMAQLKVLELGKNEERLTWKLKLVRMLYERGYNRQQVLNLLRFVDWLVALPKELEQSFQDEVNRYEEANKMPYVTTFERFGIQKGRREGRQEGLREGLLEAIELGLSIKFGEDGLQLMPEVQKIEDIALLRKVKTAVRDAKRLSTIAKLLEKINEPIATTTE